MLNRPRQTATWYRYVLGAGAISALTAVGAAAMWSGWLPSRPLQWNEINGRLNLGQAGAAVRADRPIVVNQWPSAGSVGYQAKVEGSAIGGNAATFAERFPRRDARDDKEKEAARWGGSSKSHLTGTAGRSNLGGSMGGPGGGLGAGGGVAQVPKQSPPSQQNASKASSPAKPSSPGRSGSRGGAPVPSAPAPVPSAPAPPVTTVADLATGIPAASGAPTFVPQLGFGTDPLPAGSPAPVVAATPEPASIMLIGTGLLTAAGLIRRRRQ
jgi:hypothetical protein